MADQEVQNFEKALEILGDDPKEVEPNELPTEEVDDGAELEATPTDEEVKPDEEAAPEPAIEPAIEPPTSWRSDEKELFKNLPREAQEIALRLQQAQDSHFTQRSTELAQKIRATDDERQSAQQERARLAQELSGLQEMAAQLLPAAFSDIRSETDYIRLKQTDPERASKFEAFQMALRRSTEQQRNIQNQQQQEHLNREWATLQEKDPDFKDTAKAQAKLDAVRKTAMEFYGFQPQEVAVIGDHRYVQVILDAKAWRDHQANLKSAALKKTAPAPVKTMKPNAAPSTAALANDKRAAILNRAGKAPDERSRAELLAALL